MNIYVLIEGEKATKKLYQSWIPLVNSDLKPIDTLQEFKKNNFLIVAGFGQPGYWQRLNSAILDVNRATAVDRLVISVDSEDKSYEGRLAEAQAAVERAGCRVDVKYVIQHFCLETWLLGNATIFRKKPTDKELCDFMGLFNVRTNDPEDLPVCKQYSLNRAQFAYRYLRAGLRDMYGTGTHNTYSKNDPGVAIKESFFYQVEKRYSDMKHILSFEGFLNAFA